MARLEGGLAQPILRGSIGDTTYRWVNGRQIVSAKASPGTHTSNAAALTKTRFRNAINHLSQMRQIFPNWHTRLKQACRKNNTTISAEWVRIWMEAAHNRLGLMKCRDPLDTRPMIKSISLTKGITWDVTILFNDGHPGPNEQIIVWWVPFPTSNHLAASTNTSSTGNTGNILFSINVDSDPDAFGIAWHATTNNELSYGRLFRPPGL